jgi:1A family penicillin-binding protein
LNISFKVLKLFRFVFYSGLIAAAIVVIGVVTLIFYSAKDLPKLPKPLSRMIEIPQTQIYAASGQMLIALGERETIPLNMVSQNFINAIIATEDHRFFEHHGINKLRTIYSLYITLFKSGRVQGASTITQQLAKNLFFSFEQSFERKFKELLVSFQIEASNTKEGILHAYINQIHFGAGAQGIEKAARVFFGKTALDLTLSEAALLAGLPKSPTGYNPYRHYDRALKRRDTVLQRMVDAGFITEAKFRSALEDRPELHRKRSDSRTGSYFLDTLINELVKKYGEDVVFHGGIKVYATIDTKLQKIAENSIKEGLERLDNLMGLKVNTKIRPQGSLVAVDTGSGAVKAMVGGRNYYESEFNRAYSSRRQPGSGFKPFLYYDVFKKYGFHPVTIMEDKPVLIKVKGSSDWEPRNFSKGFQGNMILKKALTESVNTIAAQLVEITGPESVTATAKACGIRSPLQNVYSIALGTANVTVLDMASAFATFSTQGVYHEPFYFWRVEDAFGRVIFEHIVHKKRVLEPSVTYQIVDMMKSVVDIGSGQSIRKLGFKNPAAGKTGTSNSYNDAWFTGFTPTLSTSIWTGFDKEKKLIDKSGIGITGGRSAAPIWADFMGKALKGEPERDFPIPDDIRFESVDARTGCTPENAESVDIFTVPLKTGQIACPKEVK